MNKPEKVVIIMPRDEALRYLTLTLGKKELIPLARLLMTACLPRADQIDVKTGLMPFLEMARNVTKA